LRYSTSKNVGNLEIEVKGHPRSSESTHIDQPLMTSY